jgi:circadian clock protein KaiC
MVVVKVRGSAHSNELREFEITDASIVIGDPVRDHEGLLGRRPMQTIAPAAVEGAKLR